MLILENPLNASPLVFPVLECFHIVGMAIFVGTVAAIDFRVLGWGFNRQSTAEIADDVKPWSHIGLALILLSGPMMFSSDPDMYYLNHAFQAKMTMLLVGLIFNFTVHRKMVTDGGNGKGIAWTSLLIWASVIAGGIFIAFV